MEYKCLSFPPEERLNPRQPIECSSKTQIRLCKCDVMSTYALCTFCRALANYGGSVVECLTPNQGAGGQAKLASLCCVLEQDTSILA